MGLSGYDGVVREDCAKQSVTVVTRGMTNGGLWQDLGRDKEGSRLLCAKRLRLEGAHRHGLKKSLPDRTYQRSAPYLVRSQAVTLVTGGYDYYVRKRGAHRH